MNKYHCCATCIHFCPVKESKRMRYFCSRLQYETKPDYKFNCWNPKENIRRLIDKQKEEKN